MNRFEAKQDLSVYPFLVDSVMAGDIPDERRSRVPLGNRVVWNFGYSEFVLLETSLFWGHGDYLRHH